MKMNLGCGPDVKEGWLNVDLYERDDVIYWDMINFPRARWLSSFDYILVNHVFCTMPYEAVDIALQNIRFCLKPGGTLEVIDMNPLKAFESYQNNDPEGLPGFGGSLDNRLCHHLVGHGRKSLYTPLTMMEKLERNGFINVKDAQESEHDLRPKESLVVTGQR